MDKYEFNIKVEQIKKLVNKSDFATAMKISDTIDWRRVRNANLLSMISQVYEKNREYQEAKEVLLLAYERAPIGKRLLYKLAELALKEGSLDEAEDYYREFCDLAPEDARQHILRYLILKEKDGPMDQLIRPLERYIATELDEKWMYELAELYARAGRSADCIQLCDKMILLFGIGTYVEKAMDLKQRYAPLTRYQRNLMENRDVYEERLRAVEEEYENGTGRVYDVQGGYGAQGEYGNEAGGYGSQDGYGAEAGGYGVQDGYGTGAAGYDAKGGYETGNGSYGGQGGYGAEAGGYGAQGGYESGNGGYGGRGGCETGAGGYGSQGGYESGNGGYGAQGGYGSGAGGYGSQGGYESGNGGYGAQGGYGAEVGGYGSQGGYESGNGGYGAQGGYGSGAGGYGAQDGYESGNGGYGGQGGYRAGNNAYDARGNYETGNGAYDSGAGYGAGSYDSDNGYEAENGAYSGRADYETGYGYGQNYDPEAGQPTGYDNARENTRQSREPGRRYMEENSAYGSSEDSTYAQDRFYGGRTPSVSNIEGVDEELMANLHQAAAEKELAAEMSRISTEGYTEYDPQSGHTKVFGQRRGGRVVAPYVRPELPEDEPRRAGTYSSRSYVPHHLMIEAKTPEEGFGAAVEVLKKIHEETGIDNQVIKISGSRLSSRGVFNVSDKLAGKDLIVEEAGDLSQEDLEELQMLMERDETGMIVVLIDNPLQMEELHRQNPGFINLFKCFNAERADDWQQGQFSETPEEEAETVTTEGETAAESDDRDEETARQEAVGTEDSDETREAAVGFDKDEDGIYGEQEETEEEETYEDESVDDGYEDEAADDGEYEEDEYEDEPADDGEYEEDEYEDEAVDDGEYEEDEYEDEPADDGEYEEDEYEDEAVDDGEYEEDEYEDEPADDGDYEDEEYEDESYEESDYEESRERDPADDEELSLNEFADYAVEYANDIDCSITGKSMLALYERIEVMEEDGIPLTRANAEDLIEEAADKAEKPSLGGLIKNVFSSKYNKEGLLILKEEHFI